VPDYTVRPEGHEWVAATWIPVTERQARHSQKRPTLTYRPTEAVKLEVAEVICAHCRRVFEDAVDDDCVVGIHLRGGPIGERKKRKGVTAEDGSTVWDEIDDVATGPLAPV
jgi:hypothetical protein